MRDTTKITAILFLLISIKIIGKLFTASIYEKGI